MDGLNILWRDDSWQTRLAPDIIRAILEGRQPRHLNLHAMRGRQGEVPLDWEGQRRMFGSAAASE